VTVISVILLAHNEAGSIQREIVAFNDVVVRHLPRHELIIAEDGSSDGTRERIEAVRETYGLKIVGAVERLGYARAVRNAVAQAGGDFIFICDGGEKHAPSDFWKLYDRRHDADLIIGRRTERRDRWYRLFLTSALNLFVRLFFGVDMRDADSGIRLYNRRVVDQVFTSPLLFRGFISTEIAVRASKFGLRCLEVPVSYRRGRTSRGLPLRNMPRAILCLLADSWTLKRELRMRT
jgi:glycosyltransferase involved in cell wall biosynthesis